MDFLSELLVNEWLWVTILGSISVLVLPFVIMVVLLCLPPELRFVMMLALIIGSGVAGGYKDWSLHKHKEEKEKWTPGMEKRYRRR